MPWISGLSQDADDEVPVRTRLWCTVVMIPAAAFCCLMQCAFAAQQYMDEPQNGMYVWMIVSTLLAFVFPFLLTARSRYPELVFWLCCAVVLIFPYDPMLLLMALTALIARRSSMKRTVRVVGVATVIVVGAHLRDALNTPESSLWHMIFAKPHTGQNGVPLEMLTGETPVVVTAVSVALIEVVIATLIGLHIRSRANLQTVKARADAATSHAATLQSDLNNQQLADAIAAEAHDTLAHSLSLLALNASALQAEAGKLEPSAQAQALVRQCEDIRRQAAGALDEAHAIIDMLRHPQQAWEQLIPSDETALTRESLDSLVGDARNAGMRLNTWIDIQQLSALDEGIGKIAYRAIQEGLTNARRHAPDAPVSLEVTANPTHGVHVHVSNPAPPTTTAKIDATDSPTRATSPSASQATPAQSPVIQGSARPAPTITPHDGSHSHNGLAGLTARIASAHGACRYGFDERLVFHLDVRLPWIASARR
ncbi:histidine kinase [Bifidobacterium eulemuris]|uniref:histidine kinase n=2 Tax=Bifidobacterium eulemuris TaxID=1765219 RepID=A0A261G7Q8_9BIFI|nr:histidine kinase [Bifidobacterium eulemuris]OZG67460.1 histidine kinase [Bifidobacterium eulemuris]